MADDPAATSRPEPAPEPKFGFTRELDDGSVVPTDFQLRIVWRAITGVAFAAIAVLVILFIASIGRVLWFLQPVLVPVAVAGILAYLIDPIVLRLHGRQIFGKEISRIWAIVIVFVAATIGMALLSVSIIIPATEQFPRLVNTLGKAYQDAYTWGAQQFEWLHPQTGDAGGDEGTQTMPPDPEALGKAAGWAFTGIKGVLGALGNFFGFLGYSIGFLMVPVYLFFFLKDSHSIRDRWGDYVPLRASPFKDEVIDVLKEVNGYLIAFFRGQVLVSIIDGVLIGIALLFVPGMAQYAIIFAVLLAILGVIPFVGFILTLVPAVTIAFAQSGGFAAEGSWKIPLIVALIFIVVQQFDGIVVQPRIVGESVGLHPLTVIFSVFFWSLLIGGILGALLAVPLTASVKVLFRRYIWENKLKSDPAAA